MTIDYGVDLFSPSIITQILREYSLSLKPRFGQNFLINRDIAKRILQYAELQQKDTVLEVGPGLGTLTFLMAERVQKLIAIEIDRGFTRYIRERIEHLGYRNIIIINNDILGLLPGNVYGEGIPDKVISNFPYSIGLKAILKLLDEYEPIKEVIGTVQNEIAERITAKPGEKDYSYVSVYLGFLSQTRVIEKNIAPGNFFPVPEVSSSIIKITRRKIEWPVEKKFFKKILRSCFSNRRKSIVNNLLSLGIGMKKDVLQSIVLQHFPDKHIRAERLTTQDFIDLAKHLKKMLRN